MWIVTGGEQPFAHALIRQLLGRNNSVLLVVADPVEWLAAPKQAVKCSEAGQGVCVRTFYDPAASELWQLQASIARLVQTFGQVEGVIHADLSRGERRPIAQLQWGEVEDLLARHLHIPLQTWSAAADFLAPQALHALCADPLTSAGFAGAAGVARSAQRTWFTALQKEKFGTGEVSHRVLDIDPQASPQHSAWQPSAAAQPVDYDALAASVLRTDLGGFTP